MTFELVSPKYTQKACDLLAQLYAKERGSVSPLPAFTSSAYTVCRDSIERAVAELFAAGNGMAAFTDDGTLAGFLSFPAADIAGFFGTCTGAYSPLHAHAFCDTSAQSDGMTCEQTASLLFEKVSQDLVWRGNTSFALTLFAHDTAVLSSFVLNGFGIRCADAIKNVEPGLFTGADNGHSIEYRIFTAAEILDNAQHSLFESLFDRWLSLNAHLESSPVYFACLPPTKERFAQVLKERNCTVFAAVDRSDVAKVAGYIELFSGGENVISEPLGESGFMRHICGAYVAPEYRGSFVDSATGRVTSIAEQLLRLIENTCNDSGITLLGVDCETLNPNALHFWGKYFDTYTYSVHRRIDERCQCIMSNRA